MNAIRRKLALAKALALALVLGGCGGGGDGDCSKNPAGPGCVRQSPPPSPVVERLITEGSYSGLGARFLVRIPFTTDATGALRATVDWTFTTDDVDVYIVRGTCTIEQFNGRTCPFVTFSESVSSKPETVSASNQAPGSYSLYIGNWGPDEESVSFQVFLTTGGTSSSSGSTTQVRRAGRGAEFVGILSGR